MTACSSNAALLALVQNDTDQPHYVPPPCQVACPIGTDVGSYVGYIWLKEYEKALEAITATNPFSGVCGRVCDAPCEPACRRASGDGAVTIRHLKRFVLDKLGDTWSPPVVQPTTDRSVAIVGSGPAGLTAAKDIAAAGYRVHVYEAAPKAGGMMIWGIPDFRLPPEVVDQDIRHILEAHPGIEMHLSTPLGEAVTLDGLTARHDAVLLAIGASAGKRLGVPGDDLPGVVDGVTFLSDVNGGARPAMPETVLIVGGGDVAMDACRAARRLSATAKIKVLYRRGPSEIPARRYELEAAIAEGVEILYNVQPVAVTSDAQGQPVLRVVATSLGDPDDSGRRRPVMVPGSEQDMPAGLIIAAVGQKAVSLELARHGLLANDRIPTDADSMRTPMPHVYSAGDAAFGSSTLVNAMAQGHKAAYYILNELEGIANPAPYTPPHRTRVAPVAQDPLWEKFPAEPPEFVGISQEPDAFGDAELGYSEESAMAQAARCYRCDTETGSVDYSVKLRETIFEMARPGVAPAALSTLTRKRLPPRPDPFPAGHIAGFDELTFLPANLTRLVIDPYREACKTKTDLGDGLVLDQPLLVGGFDEVPDDIRAAIAAGVRAGGGASVGRVPLAESVPWVQVIDAGSRADPQAVAVVQGITGGLSLPRPAYDGQLVGLAVGVGDLAAAVPFAIAHKADLLILDGSGHFGEPHGELYSEPDLSVIAETIRLLRLANAEESMALIYYGGLRSGTDLAKAISLGVNAGISDVAVAFAAGAEMGAGGLVFPPLATAKQRTEAVANFLKAAASEVSMMARCTGKTDVHNLEPEDLRSLTIAAQLATGIVIAGQRQSAALEAV